MRGTKNFSRTALAVTLLTFGLVTSMPSGAATKKCVPKKGVRVCPKVTTTKKRPTTIAANKTAGSTTSVITVALTTLPVPSTYQPPVAESTTSSSTTTTRPVPVRPTGNDIVEWQTYFRATFPATDQLVTSTDTAAINCGGKPLIIRGTGLSVQATSCTPVLVDGNANTLRLDNLQPGLTILGNNNTVLFQTGAANGITIAGNSNSVSKG